MFPFHYMNNPGTSVALYDEVVSRHRVECQRLNTLRNRLQDLQDFEKSLQLSASKCLIETGAGCYLQAEIEQGKDVLYNIGCDIFIPFSIDEALQQIELDKIRVKNDIESIETDLGEDYYILMMQELALEVVEN